MSTTKPNKCEKEGCSDSTPKHQNVVLHHRKHVKSYQCSYESCMFVTKSKRNLESHIWSHFEFKRYRCCYEGCHYASNYKSNLERHVWTHFDVKPYRCDVTGCKFRARFRSNLRKHMKRIHKTS